MTTRLGSFAVPSEDAFRTVLALGSGAALVGFVVAAFIPRRRPEGPTAARAESATGAGTESPESPEVPAAKA
ncbi:hypothetical protein [Streptomyces sp. NBC_01635]|uniref:hypothetical protein n=1 Tax=Streptomyces TaxID=1883 RepID=UPI0038631799